MKLYKKAVACLLTAARKSTIKFYKNSERFLFILKQYK